LTSRNILRERPYSSEAVSQPGTRSFVIISENCILYWLHKPSDFHFCRIAFNAPIKIFMARALMLKNTKSNRFFTVQNFFTLHKYYIG
jgi:hypothetical protein